MKLTIEILLPDNAEVSVRRDDLETPVETRGESTNGPAVIDRPAVERYWRYLTSNSQTLFSAMARHELESGPFTYEDIGERLGLPRETLYAFKRNEGRGRNKWERETGSKAPIYLIEDGPVQDRQIMRWRLPDGLAEVIASLDQRPSSR